MMLLDFDCQEYLVSDLTIDIGHVIRILNGDGFQEWYLLHVMLLD